MMIVVQNIEHPPRVGFIGVGAIAEALILGMCAEGEQRLCSPGRSISSRRECRGGRRSLIGYREWFPSLGGWSDAAR